MSDEFEIELPFDEAMIEKEWQQLEETWQLIEQANPFFHKNGNDVGSVWEAVFSKSPLVDVAATEGQGQTPPKVVLLTNPFLIRLNEQTGNWIPDRRIPPTFIKKPAAAG